MKRFRDWPSPDESMESRVERPFATNDSGIDEAWSAFLAEVRTLLASRLESMSPEQLDRLEAISDVLVHLAGHAESLRRNARPESDLRLVDELDRRRALARRGRAEKIIDNRHAVARPQQSHPGLLSDHERIALRRRILAGLHAEQLRVREATDAPYEYVMSASQPITRQLLRELAAQHRAVVLPELAVAAGVGAQLWDVECATTIDVPGDLPRGTYIALKVAGDSMEPLIHSGDVVLVHVDGNAASGTVVVARDPDHGYVIKEVGRLTANGIELRSLNPDFPTLRVPYGAGTVLGTVVLRWSTRLTPGNPAA